MNQLIVGGIIAYATIAILLAHIAGTLERIATALEKKNGDLK